MSTGIKCRLLSCEGHHSLLVDLALYPSPFLGSRYRHPSVSESGHIHLGMRLCPLVIHRTLSDRRRHPVSYCSASLPAVCHCLLLLPCPLF